MGEESGVPCMYLDAAGYVAVGRGHLLPMSAKAAELPFRWGEAGAAAGTVAIREEYAAVRGLAPNQQARYYLERTRLRLSPADLAGLIEGVREAR